MEYYSTIKKNEIMPLAETLKDLEIIILSEVRERQIYHLHVISKYIYIYTHILMNLSTKQKQTHGRKRADSWLPRGRDGVGGWG